MGVTMVELKVDRVVVPMGVDPLVKLRVAMQQPAGCSLLVFFGSRPRIEVEVVVELRVGTANGERAELAAEGAVIDVRRPPEVTTGR